MPSADSTCASPTAGTPRPSSCAPTAAGAFSSVPSARLSHAERGFDVRFSNGGHPLPLILRTDGRVDSVDGGRGQLVGAVEHAEFGEATLTLAPGELLLLYTDGITEV